MPTEPTRDQIAAEYFEQLRFEPYQVQEEALLAWFTSNQGVLVCAPTGMGKTLIAEAAVFEALRTGKRLYYTTPLIALTDQKLEDLQELAIRWGFGMSKIGLVTGNRRINPDAPVLVVVAEILLNRLLHPTFEFRDVSAVVMDEFHSFNDRERGVVWELTLGLLPEHVRLLLLSATVGNSLEFVNWLSHRHHRRLELVQSDERKVPLTYAWVGDMLLSEHLVEMAAGDEEARRTPALVFCFNREECWTVAEQLKGKRLLADGQQAQLVKEMGQYDWSQGVGPKLRQILLRGVGVHHAGVLPRYRRIVEDLFQRKLLSIAVCTETLAAGVNLPARSVVVPCLLKGPRDKKKLIEASSAHQMFGRAGRPQFDVQGYVFGLAHEDDVKIQRWREKYDRIPEDTKDPGLRKAKKQLKKKMPKRRTNQQYWTEAQFEKLKSAPPGRLNSRGALPWRLLAYMLQASPEVDRVRTLVGKRLMDSRHLEAGQKALDRMLITLWTAGYVRLDPPPPKKTDEPNAESVQGEEARPKEDEEPQPYSPMLAYPTPELEKLSLMRGVNPLYGIFLVNQLGIADRDERIQAMESVLELPGSVRHLVRVPSREELPPGPLATTRLDVQLLQLGLASAEELGAGQDEEPDGEPERRSFIETEERVYVLTLAEKLRRLFDFDFPGVHDVYTQSVWAAGEILQFGGDFNKYVTSKRLQKQEGIIFRHLLRLILMAVELKQLCPPDTTEEEWIGDLEDIADRLTATCRVVDPTSTDKALEQAAQPENDDT
ncbi:MAG: DEAD/DEAH box helicase [Planctomycetes bacterium]|nr:DEAD/DEAH box helicase [Planctomycetota bacterium]MBL7038723.1 DEAD/DEAH box helicase [Pirellulaceae bacterium]